MYTLKIIICVSVIIFYFPVIFLFSSIYQISKKRYLNRYYCFTNKEGVYSLHFNPIFLFFFAQKEKYFRLRAEAVVIFKSRFPNVPLHARTSTLQRHYEMDLKIQGSPIQMNWLKRMLFDFSTNLVVGYNLANLRPYRWYFPIPYMFVLFKRVYKATPKVYIIK